MDRHQISVKFNKAAINYLKGYTLIKRPCGAISYVKTRCIVKMTKVKTFLPKYSFTSTSTEFTTATLWQFRFSDGTEAYELKIFRTYANYIFHISYLCNTYYESIPETLWTPDDYKDYLLRKEFVDFI